MIFFFFFSSPSAVFSERVSLGFMRCLFFFSSFSSPPQYSCSGASAVSLSVERAHESTKILFFFFFFHLLFALLGGERAFLLFSPLMDKAVVDSAREKKMFSFFSQPPSASLPFLRFGRSGSEKLGSLGSSDHLPSQPSSEVVSRYVQSTFFRPRKITCHCALLLPFSYCFSDRVISDGKACLIFFFFCPRHSTLRVVSRVQTVWILFSSSRFRPPLRNFFFFFLVFLLLLFQVPPDYLRLVLLFFLFCFFFLKLFFNGIQPDVFTSVSLRSGEPAWVCAPPRLFCAWLFFFLPPVVFVGV